MNVLDITYDQALPLWQKLWPKRNIKPINQWVLNPKGYPHNFGLHKPWQFNPLVIDKSIKPTKVFFYGIFDKETLIGVNSGYQTHNNFRSRGLYILPKYRGYGYSKLLLNKTIDTAYILGCDVFWSVPRKESLPAYESCGLVRKGDFFLSQYGINCYAELNLDE